MRVSKAFLVALLCLPSIASAIGISYNFTGPINPDNTPVPTESIIGFGMRTRVLSARLGPMSVPAPPTLAGRALGSIFIPGQNVVLPNTRDGVAPKTGADPRFDFDNVTFNLGGTPLDPGRRPAGATFRLDDVALDWTRTGKEFTFGPGYQLSFGGQIDVDNSVYRSQVSLLDAAWKLDDGTFRSAGQAARNTMRLGQNLPDPNGAEVAGLTFDRRFLFFLPKRGGCSSSNEKIGTRWSGPDFWPDFRPLANSSLVTDYAPTVSL